MGLPGCVCDFPSHDNTTADAVNMDMNMDVGNRRLFQQKILLVQCDASAANRHHNHMNNNNASGTAAGLLSPRKNSRMIL